MDLERLSFEHKISLEFCFDLRKEIARKKNPKKLKEGILQHYSDVLKPHFELEEKFVFPILGEGHPAVKQAITEHRRISALCTMNASSLLLAEQFVAELDQHIRFEEKVIFDFVKNFATKEQLQRIAEMHH